MSGNQNVHLKFLSQNGRQFSLHYVRGAIETVGVTCMYDTGLGQDISLGVPAPSLVVTLMML